MVFYGFDSFNRKHFVPTTDLVNFEMKMKIIFSFTNWNHEVAFFRRDVTILDFLLVSLLAEK